MNKVSILIPVYARTDQDVLWLINAVESAITQGEVVVVDDGSPFTVDPGRLPGGVHFARIEHGGKGVARNLAVLGASHDLIYPLDADDWLEPNAIQTLLSQWDKTPLYGDVKKWYTNGSKEPHWHKLPNFSCELIKTTCISSVNVLHTKAQHRANGGWPTDMTLFEDWHYNARLFWRFEATHVAAPVVNYRQHAGQSTVRLKNEYEAARTRVIEGLKGLDKIMGCCGKGRKPRNAPPSTPTASRSASRAPLVPLSDGVESVRAIFMDGKGQGRHYYLGPETRHRYYAKYGETINADKRDTVSRLDFEQGRSKCKLVRVEATPNALPPIPAPVASPEPIIVQAPPPPTPVAVLDVSDDRIKEIEGMTVRDILAASKGWSQEVKAEYLAAENARVKSRISVVKLLSK